MAAAVPSAETVSAAEHATVKSSTGNRASGWCVIPRAAAPNLGTSIEATRWHPVPWPHPAWMPAPGPAKPVQRSATPVVVLQPQPPR